MATDSRPRMASKNLNAPDQTRALGRGIGEFVEVAGLAVGRATLEPGWRWSVDLKPMVGTASCQIHHFQMVLAGRMAILTDEGDEREVGPGEVIDLPPGHDTWVVGDEPLVIVDMSGNSADFSLPVAQSRAVVTMLMTDIVDSTRTAAEIGDPAWRQRLANHNRLVRRQLERFGGREVDTTGDGFLAAFGSAEAGLRAALAIHEAVAVVDVHVRAGVHTGEVDVLADGDLRGIAVHEAARVMAAAPAGSVYCTAISRALASASGLRFESLGVHALKGIADPVELFLVADAR